MRRNITGLFFICCLAFCTNTHAQHKDTVQIKTYRVGIFAPLYLDSVFKVNTFKYTRNFPRFVTQGLDFIQGAQIALDSMPSPSARLMVTIYDSKSYTEDLDSLIQNNRLDSLNLLIGAVRDEDYLQLARFALRKNIPFISATYPNDGGITGNPFLVIMNSTLKSHCEAIYAYLLQNHGTDNILLCRKPGAQEDRVSGYFKKLNEPDGIPVMNIRTANISDSNFNALKYQLDSTKRNIIIGASLDEYFGYNLSAEMAKLNSTYPTTLFGMPNWENFRSFSASNAFTGFPVYITSPFYNAKFDSSSKMIQDIYLKKYKGVPSDFTYKGYETVLLFTKLLIDYPEDFISHLNEPAKIFTAYQFKPVFNNGDTTPDYFENKHLYFLKLEKGKTSLAW